MHVGVLGGTFDPPHNGHLAMALFARELLSLDRLILSVSDNPLKQQRSASDSERKAMTELLCHEINRTGPFCDVCGWELEQRRPSYTVNLLGFVRSLYPSARLSLLVGEDSWRNFGSWKSPEEIEELADVVVFARGAEHMTERPDAVSGIRFVEFSCPLSSTMIREMIAGGQSVSSLLPSSIERYIRREGLYGE
ncbi:MAG: nicotinate (nicotinamide) nucleotide adenylyltransferase [Chlorobium phaeovibrioides]|nr:nicotinate (nicotinamide) nucleotide adenylyltransferase [Chlorobium phaeovibrioides]